MSSYFDSTLIAVSPVLQGVFGNPATYHYADGRADVAIALARQDSAEHVVVFDNNNRLIEMKRFLTISLTDVPDPDERDRVTFDSLLWEIHSIPHRTAAEAKLLCIRRTTREIAARKLRAA